MMYTDMKVNSNPETFCLDNKLNLLYHFERSDVPNCRLNPDAYNKSAKRSQKSETDPRKTESTVGVKRVLTPDCVNPLCHKARTDTGCPSNNPDWHPD